MAELKVVSRALLGVLHHNMAKYDQDWFGKGEAILITERVTLSDGRKVKRAVIMKDPDVRYFVTSPAFRVENENEELFYPVSKCDELTSKIKDLYRHCAEETGQMDFFNETRGPGANRRRAKIHDHRWLHGSDVNLADHYIDRYMEFHVDSLDTTAPLEMSFGDIEVDPVDHVGFPDEKDAPCPISMLTNFHAPSKRMTAFLPRVLARENPQIAEFEADLESMTSMVLAETNRAPLLKAGIVTADTPWEELYEILGSGREDISDLVRCTEVDLQFYDTELEAILAFLRHVNEVEQPDTFSFWNAHFDILTIMNRLRKNGVDPREAFTAEAFRPWCYAEYSEDTFHPEPEENGDTFMAASFTVWLDQMLIYAWLRKQAATKREYNLQYTLQEELKEGKLDIDDVRTIAYTNYKRFVLYGILDVIPMATLEEKTGDIALIYRTSMMTRTRIHKTLKKTICLRNLASVFLRKHGYVISNNRNRNKERTDSKKFRGGFVSSPSLMDYTGIFIDGTRSGRVFDDAVDLDAKALYPTNIIFANIDAMGQIGRIVLFLADGTEIISNELVEGVASGSALEIGRVWLNCPGLGFLAAEVLGLEELRPPEQTPSAYPTEWGGEEAQEVSDESRQEGERAEA
jgi:hypothetical protein